MDSEGKSLVNLNLLAQPEVQRGYRRTTQQNAPGDLFWSTSIELRRPPVFAFGNAHPTCIDFNGRDTSSAYGQPARILSTRSHVSSFLGSVCGEEIPHKTIRSPLDRYRQTHPGRNAKEGLSERPSRKLDGAAPQGSTLRSVLLVEHQRDCDAQHWEMYVGLHDRLVRGRLQHAPIGVELAPVPLCGFHGLA